MCLSRYEKPAFYPRGYQRQVKEFFIASKGSVKLQESAITIEEISTLQVHLQSILIFFWDTNICFPWYSTGLRVKSTLELARFDRSKRRRESGVYSVQRRAGPHRPSYADFSRPVWTRSFCERDRESRGDTAGDKRRHLHWPRSCFQFAQIHLGRLSWREGSVKRWQTREILLLSYCNWY